MNDSGRSWRFSVLQIRCSAMVPRRGDMDMTSCFLCLPPLKLEEVWSVLESATPSAILPGKTDKSGEAKMKRREWRPWNTDRNEACRRLAHRINWNSSSVDTVVDKLKVIIHSIVHRKDSDSTVKMLRKLKPSPRITSIKKNCCGYTKVSNQHYFVTHTNLVNPSRYSFRSLSHVDAIASREEAPLQQTRGFWSFCWI